MGRHSSDSEDERRSSKSSKNRSRRRRSRSNSYRSRRSTSREKLKYHRSSSREKHIRPKSRDRHRSRRSRSKSYIKEYSSKLRKRSSTSSSSSSSSSRSYSRKSDSSSRHDKSSKNKGKSKLAVKTVSPAVNNDSDDCVIIDSRTLEQINENKFVPKQFTSSSNKSSSKSFSENIVIDLNKQTIKVPEVQSIEPDSIFHHGLFASSEARMEKWIKDLYSYRQKDSLHS